MTACNDEEIQLNTKLTHLQQENIENT